MKKTISAICAVAVTVAALGATMVPAEAASMQGYHPKASQSDRDSRQHRFEKHGDYAYYDGHKGFKKKHAGYRYYQGYWFPPAAFLAAGVVGGILSQIHHN